MYDYLSGELIECGMDYAVLEVQGIGYRLRVPSSTASVLSGSNQVRLLTTLRIRDDHLELFGFATQEERKVFERVCTVAGIGPGTALTILSGIPIEEFRAAILSSQPEVLQKIRGIGRKTAERLIVELKEIFAGEGALTPLGTPSRMNQDAVAALVALGFSDGGAEVAVRRVLQNLPPKPLLEDVIKAASRYGA